MWSAGLMFIPGCEIQLWEKRYVGCDPEADWCGLCIPSPCVSRTHSRFLAFGLRRPSSAHRACRSRALCLLRASESRAFRTGRGSDRERATSPPSIFFLELTLLLPSPLLLPGPTPSFEILAIHLLGPQSVQKITWKWPSGQESADPCTGPRWHNCASSGRHPAEVACASQARPPMEPP